MLPQACSAANAYLLRICQKRPYCPNLSPDTPPKNNRASTREALHLPERSAGYALLAHLSFDISSIASAYKRRSS